MIEGLRQLPLRHRLSAIFLFLNAVIIIALAMFALR